MPKANWERMGVIEDFFIKPMAEKTGYNIVNTLTYAAMAMAAVYGLYLAFKKSKTQIGRDFFIAALLFVVFGASIRVVTDSVDSGAMQKFLEQNPGNAMAGAYSAVLSSHALDYGAWTVTPGIYVVTAALFLMSILITHRLGSMKFAIAAGAAFSVFPLVLLAPQFHNWAYAAAIAAMAVAAGAFFKYALKFENKAALVVFSHALDGAATWVAIDWYGPASGAKYFEQHVVSGAIGGATPLGFGLFFLAKIALSAAAAYYLTRRENREEMPAQALNLTLLAICVLGMAPGLRDMLRLLAGT